MTLYSVVTLAALFIFGWIVYDFVTSYRASTSTGAQKFLDAARGSATLLVVQCGMLFSAFGVAFGKVLDWVGAITGGTETTDAIKNAVAAHFTAEGAAVILAGFMVLVAIARFRTLGKGS